MDGWDGKRWRILSDEDEKRPESESGECELPEKTLWTVVVEAG